jgi:hypothetical protein
MNPGLKLTSAKPHVAIIVDYTNNLVKLLCFSCFGRLNIKNYQHLYFVTYSLNTLSGDPASQIFYLFCKELRFGDINKFTLIPAIDWLRVLLEPFLT